MTSMAYTVDISSFFTIMISMVFVSNFVLARFLGLCPFIGVTSRTDSAIGMGAAVTFVMTLASSVSWLIYRYMLLAATESGFNVFAALGIIKPSASLVLVLKTVTYILVIATLVQLVELVMRRIAPALYLALGIYLPLITTNCAVLGVALLNTTDTPEVLTFGAATLHGFFAGVGFALVMLLMSAIRERLDLLPVPEAMKGAPIAFVCTALMALAFMGFGGLAGAAQ
jgi:Na+-translocating ferredoxin:NAD+ oxidoreductase subunit A